MNNAISQMIGNGCSTADAHILHDMTRQAVIEAQDAIKRVAERAGPEYRATILLGALGSLAALCKAVAPVAFAEIVDLDVENVDTDSAVVIRVARDPANG